MQPDQRQIPESNTQHSSGKDNHESAEEHQQPNSCHNEEDDIVPVVIRPGHIRFEPYTKGVCFGGMNNYGSCRISV